VTLEAGPGDNSGGESGRAWVRAAINRVSFGLPIVFPIRRLVGGGGEHRRADILPGCCPILPARRRFANKSAFI